MRTKVLRFVALVLAALTVGMKLAHVLELYPKLQWGPELYYPVQTSLYRVFAVVGPIVDVGAIASIAVLAGWLRKRPAFGYTLAAGCSMIVSLILWAVIVAPANGHIQEWTSTHAVAADWARWRAAWQYGQSGSFAFDLTGFCLLLISVLKETPNEA
jgi:hypothetical protein